MQIEVSFHQLKRNPVNVNAESLKQIIVQVIIPIFTRFAPTDKRVAAKLVLGYLAFWDLLILNLWWLFSGSKIVTLIEWLSVLGTFLNLNFVDAELLVLVPEPFIDLSVI